MQVKLKWKCEHSFWKAVGNILHSSHLANRPLGEAFGSDGPLVGRFSFKLWNPLKPVHVGRCAGRQGAARAAVLRARQHSWACPHPCETPCSCGARLRGIPGAARWDWLLSCPAACLRKSQEIIRKLWFQEITQGFLFDLNLML